MATVARQSRGKHRGRAARAGSPCAGARGPGAWLLRLGLVPLVVLLLLSLAERHVAARSPDLVEALARAHARGDDGELERVARQLGTARLAGVLRSGKRSERVAAAAAAPMLRASWHLLAPLAALMGQADRALATVAASAVLRVSENLRPRDLELFDEPAESLRPVQRSLLELASRPGLSLDVRVKALLAAGGIGSLLPLRDEEILACFDAAEPELRAAAADLLLGGHPGPRVLARLARLMREDRSVAVSRAALSVLCSREKAKTAAGGPGEFDLSPGDLMARVRALLEDSALMRGDLAELALCVRRHGGAAERRAVERARARLLRGSKAASR